MKNEIFEREFYSIEKINNFLIYLKSDIKLDPSKTITQIIKDALNYDKEEEENMSSTFYPMNKQFELTKNTYMMNNTHLNKTMRSMMSNRSMSYDNLIMMKTGKISRKNSQATFPYQQ